MLLFLRPFTSCWLLCRAQIALDLDSRGLVQDNGLPGGDFWALEGAMREFAWLATFELDMRDG